MKFSAGLIGGFNVYNSLAAICMCVEQGADVKDIAGVFKDMTGIEGRAEIVMDSPCVVVDYAHTPDGLEKIYAIKDKLGKKGKNICVLGSAGGGRDIWKRPEMGRIAEKNCDFIILTDEDPYDEDPKKIISDIRAGISDKSKADVVLDRREAIAKALSVAKKSDTVFITGKGAEPIMVTKDGNIDWDDRQVVKEEYEKIVE